MTSLNKIIKNRSKNLSKSIESLAESKIHQIAALNLSNEFIGSYINAINLDWSNIPIDFDDFEKTEFHIVEMAGLLIDDKFILSVTDLMQSDRDFTRRDFNFIKIKAFMQNQLFISIMGEVEDFFSKLLLLVLQAYPEKLGEQKLKLNDIECKFKNFLWIKAKERHLAFNTSEEMMREIDKQIEKSIMEMIYKGSDEYIKKLKIYVESNKNLESFLWWFTPLYTEMKARRNAGLHNGWYRNEKYDEIVKPIKNKLKDIEKNKGIKYPVSKLDFLGVDSDYFQQTYKISRQVIEEFSSHSIQAFKVIKKSKC
ncbi:hypothetical protein [uncultured Nostoc sp.]|uniref:hypothetical protein n=1 Tax=uncultured Nostoc sp. TaxID=340711 RepID=UPI00261590FB|nr:hypothetical protein [uncultured Nostoc sp.]